MEDPEEIYLQPECCIESNTGRLWCEDDIDDCREGNPWVRYIRADLVERRATEISELQEVVKE